MGTGLGEIRKKQSRGREGQRDRTVGVREVRGAVGKRGSRELACSSQGGGGQGLGAKPQVAELLAMVSASSERQLL